MTHRRIIMRIYFRTKGFAFALITLLTVTFGVTNLHGSNMMTGAFLGAGLGAMGGGCHGIFPGMMAGMAFGGIADMASHHHCHAHHCREVYVTHEVRPSHSSQEFDQLEDRYIESKTQARHLQHKIEQKDDEIAQLEKRLGNLEYELMALKHDHITVKPGVVIEAKAIAA